MNYRTIEEAKNVKIPNFPSSFINEYNRIANIVQFENVNPIEKLELIYFLFDKVTDFISPYTVCEKGCSHCCHVKVPITSLEASYIQRKACISKDDGKSITIFNDRQKVPCTFLCTEGSCTIYKFRPFTCRTYHVIDDPKYCKQQIIQHVEYKSESNVVLKKLEKIILYLNDGESIRDIRDYFT